MIKRGKILKIKP